MDFTGERLIPDQKRDDDLFHEHIVRYLCATQLACGRTVLDAGCGAGYGSALLAAAGARSVLGVDIAADAIDYARQHYQNQNLAFAVKDVCHLALPARSFDLAVSFEVIEHLDEPALLVQSVQRVLTADGVFVVSTPNPATYPVGNPFHKHELAAAQFVEMLAAFFPAVALFEQDYATALSLRPSATGAGVGAGLRPALPPHQADAGAGVGAGVGAGLRPALPPHQADAGAGVGAGVGAGLRPALADAPLEWTFVPAAERAVQEPDYYIAVCARQQETLDQTIQSAHSIMYELPADRLGERIRDLLMLQRILDEKNSQLLQKDAHIARLENELRRQGAWATDLERQARALKDNWYVRLFGRRIR